MQTLNPCDYDGCEKSIGRGEYKIVHDKKKTCFYHYTCWKKLLVDQGKEVEIDDKHVPTWGER